MRFLGKLLGDTEFWWFAIGIPVVFWLVLMGFRLAIYLMQQIQANAWDSRREQVILQEVRRGGGRCKFWRPHAARRMILTCNLPG